MATSGTSPTATSDDVAALKKLVEEKSALVTSQAALIAILEEKLRLAVHQRFGATPEKLTTLDQSDLFNEAEAGAVAEWATEAQTSETTTVPEHTRERGKRKPIDAGLPRVRVEFDIPEMKQTRYARAAAL